GVGLKLYDALAGRLGLGPSRWLSREETVERIPTVEPEGLRGGIIYHDAQFDDARLAVSLALTLADLGGTPLNYMEVTGLTKSHDLTSGVTVRDRESGREYRLRGRVVINATGVFCDGVRQMDDPSAEPVISPSQGVHLVLDRSFLPGDCAVMVPRTDDGRVLFAVPWHDRVIVGTTDTPVSALSPEPRPLEEEIGFLLSHAGRYLTRNPARDDVLSVFAGLRPLVRQTGQEATAALSRDHTILVSGSGLVTVTGGKWTTYRRMGEDAVERAAQVAGLDPRPSASAGQRIHGWREGDASEPWGVYGSDAEQVRALAAEEASWDAPLHPGLPHRAVQVVWAVRREYARTVADVLARRTRALFLDARASMAMAPGVARLMAAELGRDAAWQQRQVADFLDVARGYLPEGSV
ncbi:MAG TPA: glycerol-3-phosphate dehydrogenase/oxidase, partial [Desulfuromonadaceae bacterium]